MAKEGGQPHSGAYKGVLRRTGAYRGVQGRISANRANNNMLNEYIVNTVKPINVSLPIFSNIFLFVLHKSCYLCNEITNFSIFKHNF